MKVDIICMRMLVQASHLCNVQCVVLPCNANILGFFFSTAYKCDGVLGLVLQ